MLERRLCRRAVTHTGPDVLETVPFAKPDRGGVGDGAVTPNRTGEVLEGASRPLQPSRRAKPPSRANSAGVVKDDAERVASAGRHSAHTMTQSRAEVAVRTPGRAAIGRKDH